MVSLSDEDSDSGGESESEEESSEEESDLEDEDIEEKGVEAELDPSRVNLDITAMIAYVSALTNGRNWFRFREKILSQQAQWETDRWTLRLLLLLLHLHCRPVKPFLDSVFQGKELVCCQSAMTDFKQILATLGGEGERERAALLVDYSYSYSYSSHSRYGG